MPVQFLVDGVPSTLADFLSANADDPAVCAWARTARPGDRFPAVADCVCVDVDRRAEPPPKAPCATTADRLACPCLKPTGYTEPGREHRRCEVTGCGFAAWVAVPHKPFDWAQHERDISRDAWEGYTAPGEVVHG